MKSRLSQIFFIALFLLPVIIINTGFERVLSVFSYWQQIEQKQTARTKLGEIESYTDFSQHLLRYSDNYLEKITSIFSNLSNNQQKRVNWEKITKNCFKEPFPENEVWLFSYDSKKNRSKNTYNNSKQFAGRRAMEMVFSFLINLNQGKDHAELKYRNRNEKLLKKLFGSSIEAEVLAIKHKAIVTPVIFKQKPSWLIWNYELLKNSQYIGYFIIVSRNQNLKRATFKLAANITGLGQKFPGGFVRLYESGQPDVLFPPRLGSFEPFKQWRKTIGLCNKKNIDKWRRQGFKWDENIGEYKLFTRIIPHEKHLLFILLPLQSYKQAQALRYAFNFFAIAFFILILCRGLILDIWPGHGIQARFFLVFILATIFPLILYSTTTISYVFDRQKADEKALQDKISASLMDFDAGKEQIENDYKTAINKCFASQKIKDVLTRHKLTKPKLLLKEIQSSFDKLPLVGIAFLDMKGNKIFKVNDRYSQKDFTSFMGFYGHNAVLNLREYIKRLNPDTTLPEYKASYENVFANQAYSRGSSPTHRELEKFRGRVFKTKFGFNKISTFYNFIKGRKNRYALFLCWLESDIEREILARSAHYLGLNQPEIEVTGFKYTPKGRKLAFKPDRSFDNQKISVFRSFADATFNSKAEQVKTVTNNMSLVAYASPKFNNTILVAGISHYENNKKHYLRIIIFSLIGFIALILVIIIGIVTYYRIARPVHAIKETLDKVKQEDFTFNNKVSRSDEIGILNQEFDSMISGLAERKRLASILSEHAIEAMSVEDSALKEKTTKAVVLISDIRDFTTMGEKYPPQTLTSMLNVHFTEMSKIITRYGGKIYKFIGDAIEAVFIEDEKLADSSADRSLSAAIEMLEKLKEINFERNQNDNFTYKIGVGLATGEIVCGETGSIDTRLEYAMIGTPFKRAEKFEAFTKKLNNLPIVFEKDIKTRATRLNESDLSKHEFENYEVFSFKNFPKETFKARIVEQTGLASFGNKINQRQKGEITKFSDRTFNIKMKKPVFLIGALSMLIPFFVWFYSCKLQVANKNSNKQNELLGKINDNMTKFRYLNQRALFEELVQYQADKIAARLTYKTNGVGRTDLKKSTTYMLEALKNVGLEPDKFILFHKPGGNKENTPDKDWKIIQKKGIKNLTFYRELMAYCLTKLTGQRYEPPIDLEKRFPNLLGMNNDRVYFYNDIHARATRVSMNGIFKYIYWQPLLIRNPDIDLDHVKDNKLPQVLKSRDYKGILNIAGAILLTVKISEVEEKLLNIIKEIIKQDKLEFAIVDENSKIRKSSGFPATKSNLNSLEHASQGSKWVIKSLNLKIQGKSLKIYVGQKFTPIQLNYLYAIIIPALIFLFLCLIWYKSVYHQAYISKSFAWQLRCGLLAAAIIPITTVYLVNEWNAIDRKKIDIEQKRIELINYFEKLERRQFFSETKNWENINKLCLTPELTGLLKQTDKTVSKENLNQVEKTVKKLTEHKIRFNEMMIFSNHGWQKMVSSGDAKRKTGDFKRFVTSFINNYFSDLGSKIKKKEKNKLAQAAKNEMVGNTGLKIFRNLFGSDAFFALTNGLDLPIKIFAHTGVALIKIIPTPGLIKPQKLFYWIIIDQRNSSMRKIFETAVGPFSVFTESRAIYGELKQPREGAYVAELSRLSRWAATNKSPVSMRTEIHNEKFIAEARLGRFNEVMVLIGLIPEERIINRVEANKRFFLIALLLSVLAITFIAIILGNDFISPIRQLTNGAHNIRLQNYSIRLTSSRNDEIGDILKSFNEMARGLQEKEIMGKMVSKSARLITGNEASLQKAEKGMKLNIVALYIAVPHFATFIETMNSKDLIEDLKFQIEHICKTIMDNNGDVDKLMGEKVLAVFYNSENINKCLEDALNAAQTLRNSERSGKLKFPLTIGIHTGEVLAGLLGAGSNRDFTVIGDTVNTAARICSKGSNLPRERVLISESAVQNIELNNYELRNFGEVQLKGKASALKLYQIFFKKS